MKKGALIGIGIVVVGTVFLGVFITHVLQKNSAQSPTTSAAQNTPAQIKQTITVTDSQTCAAFANQAAQHNQVIEAHFSSSTGACYYELNIFTDSGTETDIRVAPNDTTVASCTTSAAGALVCTKPGVGAITEPQFKQLLANDFTN